MPKSKTNPRPSSVNASSLSVMGQKIAHYVQAGYAGIYLVSPEEQRVEAEMVAVVEHLNRVIRDGKGSYQLCYWSVVDGLVNIDRKSVV